MRAFNRSYPFEFCNAAKETVEGFRPTAAQYKETASNRLSMLSEGAFSLLMEAIEHQQGTKINGQSAK